MALKFLNKKGWHTGSLRNIENVWKAEQKHDAEEKKLEELRKQIHEERERSEFRELQVQAGLVPRQERLEFLYDSGLAVGKGNSSSGVAFKALESTTPKTDPAAASSSQDSAVPGALFEDKPQSANDAWRKLHSDPLLMIRQKEQEALARVKNNPVRMAMILKSVEEDTKNKEKLHAKDEDKRSSKRKHHHKKDKSSKRQEKREASDSDSSEGDRDDRRIKSSSKHSKHRVGHRNSDERVPEKKYSERHEGRRDEKRDHRNSDERVSDKKYSERHVGHGDEKRDHGNYDERVPEKKYSERHEGRGEEKSRSFSSTSLNTMRTHEPVKRRNAVKLTDEERAAKLREMQMDAELHEDQRWKRIKKAEEDDAKEAVSASISRGKNFLDDVQKNVYGTGNAGSATIEESVRRRAHYLQGRSDTTDRNAFRR